MFHVQFLIKFSKSNLFALLLLMSHVAYTQNTTTFTKLPQAVFIDLITKTVKFEVNHSTQFKHADLPKNYHNTFLSYIKDSVATPIPDLKSIVYYNFTLADGRIINGDIYWNSNDSYILFKIENKTYINYFSKDGIAQIKTLFKI
jgi:hypothetical protein